MANHKQKRKEKNRIKQFKRNLVLYGPDHHHYIIVANHQFLKKNFCFKEFEWAPTMLLRLFIWRKKFLNQYTPSIGWKNWIEWNHYWIILYQTHQQSKHFDWKERKLFAATNHHQHHRTIDDHLRFIHSFIHSLCSIIQIILTFGIGGGRDGKIDRNQINQKEKKTKFSFYLSQNQICLSFCLCKNK